MANKRIKFRSISRKTRNFFGKSLHFLLVDVVRSTHAKLAHLDFIIKKIIELIFKLNIPFHKVSVTTYVLSYYKFVFPFLRLLILVLSMCLPLVYTQNILVAKQ